jgi:hypothetical protein
MNFNLKFSYEFDFIIIGSWNTTFSLSDSALIEKFVGTVIMVALQSM